VVVCGN